MSDWKDISEAPTDGTPVLLWADSAGFSNKFARITGAFNYGAWRIYGPVFGEPTNFSETAQWLGEVRPILYQDLPAAPQLVCNKQKSELNKVIEQAAEVCKSVSKSGLSGVLEVLNDHLFGNIDFAEAMSRLKDIEEDKK